MNFPRVKENNSRIIIIVCLLFVFVLLIVLISLNVVGIFVDDWWIFIWRKISSNDVDRRNENSIYSTDHRRLRLLVLPAVVDKWCPKVRCLSNLWLSIDQYKKHWLDNDWHRPSSSLDTSTFPKFVSTLEQVECTTYVFDLFSPCCTTIVEVESIFVGQLTIVSFREYRKENKDRVLALLELETRRCIVSNSEESSKWPEEKEKKKVQNKKQISTFTIAFFL